MIEEFDAAIVKELRTLNDVDVFVSRRPDDSYSGKSYLVFLGNSALPGAPKRHRPINSVRDASVYHPLGVFIATTSAQARNAIVSAVRRRVIGFQFNGSGEVEETGEQNAYGETDSVIKPARYTAYLTFQVLLDRII